MKKTNSNSGKGKITPIPHKTLEERLTEFYNKPIDQIERIESEEIDWGKPEGNEEN